MVRKISLEEYNGYKELVACPKPTRSRTRGLEKKKLSEERQSRWPNTLEALRKKKEQAYFERLEAEEERRKQNDRDEDQRKTEDRRKKIEYAASVIYRNTDKAKRLASAELLSECLDARDKQLHLKGRIAEAEKAWEAEFLIKDHERLKKMEAREIAEAKARKDKAAHVAKVQQEQLDEVRQRHIEALKEREEEGRRLLEAHEKMEEEAREKVKQDEDRARQSRLELVQANEEIKTRRAKFAAREEEEDAKIAEYAKQKEELKIRQQKQAAKIESAKQRRRQEMIEQGTRRLQELNNMNNARLENEIAEARRMEDERFRILAEKRAAFARTIDNSRRAQVEAKIEERRLEKERETDLAKRWREYNVTVQELEKEELAGEFAAAKEHQQILLNQAQEREEKRLEMKRQEIHEARTLKDQGKVELEEFEKIARERIEHVKSLGRDTYPLVKCLSDIKNGR